MSMTYQAWKKVSHKVMNIVYRRSTYFLNDLILCLNITCTKFWNSGVCTRHRVWSVFELETWLTL